LKFANGSAVGFQQIDKIYKGGSFIYEVGDDKVKELKKIATYAPYLAHKGTFGENKDLNWGVLPNGRTIKWFCGTEDEDAFNAAPKVDVVDLDASNFCLSITKCDFATTTNLESEITEKYGASISSMIKKHILYADEVRKKANDLLNLLTRESTGNSYYKSIDDDMDNNGFKEFIDKALEIGDADEMAGQMSDLGQNLKKALSCEYMKESFGRVEESLCGDVIQRIVFTAVLLAVASCISVVISLTLVFGNRCFGTSNTRDTVFDASTPKPTSTVTPIADIDTLRGISGT
jgi:hypothetical protein